MIPDDTRTCAFHRSSGCSICVVRFLRPEEWTVINENEHSSYPTEWTNLVDERTLRREAAVTVPGLRYKQSRALFPLLCHVSNQRHVRSRPALTILDCTVQVDALYDALSWTKITDLTFHVLLCTTLHTFAIACMRLPPFALIGPYSHCICSPLQSSCTTLQCASLLHCLPLADRRYLPFLSLPQLCSVLLRTRT